MTTPTLRTDVRPGDLGTIVALHGLTYAAEYGFDATFEAYVAGPLAEFVRLPREGERLWIAESGGHLAGCVAIVAAGERVAQLRWYLVAPSARGQGLGKRLLAEAITYCQQCGYEKVFLWTVAALTEAAKLYRAFGFVVVEEKPGRHWGVEVVEQRYELVLSATPSHSAAH